MIFLILLNSVRVRGSRGWWGTSAVWLLGFVMGFLDWILFLEVHHRELVVQSSSSAFDGGDGRFSKVKNKSKTMAERKNK